MVRIMLLYIIRHGDPIYAPDSLTELGHVQAQALAKRLAVNGLDRIYVSPLNRAIQTARPTAELLGLEMHIEEWASESLAWKELSFETDEGWRWGFHQQSTKFKNGETLRKEDWYNIECFKKGTAMKSGYERISEASDEFLCRLGYKHEDGLYRIIRPNEERIALFCHQGLGVTWISHLLDIPPQIFWAGFDITHTGISIFDFHNNENGLTNPKCLCMSDTSHLYKEGLPLNYNNCIRY